MGYRCSERRLVDPMGRWEAFAAKGTGDIEEGRAGVIADRTVFPVDIVGGTVDTAVDTVVDTEGTMSRLGSTVQMDSWNCCNGWSLGNCSTPKGDQNHSVMSSEMNRRAGIHCVHDPPTQPRVLPLLQPRLHSPT